MAEKQTSQELSQKASSDPDNYANPNAARSRSKKQDKGSQWRTFTTSSYFFAQPLVKNGENFKTIAFMMHVDLRLGTILSREDLISQKVNSFYAEMVFRMPEPMTLIDFDMAVDKIENLEQVFTWIPTYAVNLGRRGCYTSVGIKYPSYKINVVTNDDGKIETALVTVFASNVFLHQNLNQEIDFYRKRKGILRLNTDLLEDIPGLDMTYNPNIDLRQL